MTLHNHFLPENTRTGEQPSFAQFKAIQSGCERHGGLSTGEELVRQLGRHHPQPISMLARWIVEGEVLSFTWHAQLLLPMFQFELPALTVRKAVGAVLAELIGAYDDWEATSWFVQPHPLLRDACPVDVLEGDPGAVTEAARTDRFVILG